MVDVKGNIISSGTDPASGKYIIVLSTDYPPEGLPEDVSITIQPWRDTRSQNANALFWSLINKLAKMLHEDKWRVYREMLRRYGEFESVLVEKDAPDALSEIARKWRDYEITGEVTQDGRQYFEVLCYYGSSQLDSLGFSNLIDGVRSEINSLEQV